jgi:DNA-binding transcriptional regulator GbsR (MarR family)
MNIQNDQKQRECADLQQRIKIMEYDLAKSIQRSDDCSRLLEQRSQDLKAKELALKELEGEVVRLKTV